MTQKERTDALQALRDGHARACVATDVAARGLDLPDLGLVIHADLPVNKAGLLHRSGRTGRAGKKGISVLVVPYNKRRFAERLLDSASIDAGWSGPPLADEIRAKDQQRLLDDPILTEPPSEEDLALAQKILADSSPEAGGHRADPPAPPAPAGAGGPVRRRAATTGQIIPSARPQRGGASYDPHARGPGRRAAASGERRRRVVPHADRAAEQRRPQVADPADLPPGPRHQEGHRPDPHLRPRDQVRDHRRDARPASARR